jgi:pilus assembly protein CpaF
MDQLRRELHERLLATLDFAAASAMKREQLVAQCDARVRELIDLSGRTVPAEMRAQLVRGVLDDVFGLGPLEPLFADGEITDILVVSPDRVFVERRGQLRQSDARFRDNAHLLHIIHRITTYLTYITLTPILILILILT